MPFVIESIQIDGGSELMKYFETACAQLGIKLYVLPPKSPRYNSVVERYNGVTRDDFYSIYNDIFDLPKIRSLLATYQYKNNNYRTHQALNNLAPVEKLNN